MSLPASSAPANIPSSGASGDLDISDEDALGLPADSLEASELRSITASLGQHGVRIDKVLVDAIPEFSRSYLQQLLAQGLVRINGAQVQKPALRVQAGDQVSIELRPTLQSQAFRPEPMALDVVYEDEHLLVIHKPAGLVVHPAPGNWSGTLLNGLLARDPKAALVPRAGIVHRLDKDTSGLMVVARERSIMDALVNLIAQRQVSRQYLALAHKPWSGPAQRTVQAPIGRDPRQRLRMAVVDLATQAGKEARTDFECLESSAQGCWVRCTLHTGRTHQIRVHMASIGHTLVGDALYGGPALPCLERQALHAYRLAFIHPATQAPLIFEAPVPPDIQQALAHWGLRYNFS